MGRRNQHSSFIMSIIGWSTVVLFSVLAFFGPLFFERTVPTRGMIEMLLANSNEGFSQADPGYTLTFPKDYGVHETFRQEWWYVTANLMDETGQHYGVQWTLFRSALFPEKPDEEDGWNNNQIYMAHVVVTTESGTYSAERFARGGIGQAGVTLLPFTAWLDNWQWSSSGDSPFPATLQAEDKSFSFTLTMNVTQPEVLQGEGGFSRKHATENVASHYFSVPRIDIAGTLTVNGKSTQVTGKGWVDREWNSQALSNDQQGWDWFSLQLNDGRSVMVAQVRSVDDPYRFGVFVNEDGRVKSLSQDDFSMEPLSFHKVSYGRHIPTEWQITLVDEKLTFTTKPINENNWLPFTFPYWEGPIYVTGSVEGMGFMEVTGY